jgi:arylformamidase
LYVNGFPGIVSYDEHNRIIDHSIPAINKMIYSDFSPNPACLCPAFELLLFPKSPIIMVTEAIIDLTHQMESNMPVFPGTAPVNFTAASTFEKEGYQEIRIDCSTHTGTHIDCGYHILASGLNVISTPLNCFYGNGVVADCRRLKPGGFISKEYLQSIEMDIIPSDFLLIHTGWSQYWGSDEYFSHFPVLDEEAANYLASFNLKGIGSDTISFDLPDSRELPVHHILLSAGLILVENLVNLESLPKNNFTFSCLPLKISNGDGSPVRAVGIVRSEK